MKLDTPWTLVVTYLYQKVLVFLLGCCNGFVNVVQGIGRRIENLGRLSSYCKRNSKQKSNQNCFHVNSFHKVLKQNLYLITKYKFCKTTGMSQNRNNRVRYTSSCFCIGLSKLCRIQLSQLKFMVEFVGKVVHYLIVYIYQEFTRKEVAHNVFCLVVNHEFHGGFTFIIFG